ncbi:hypothetical protein [Mastigocoleus testarum]|uniref:Uncharacterized protein n=1 Tax=Mastigocoleus testarum BC008 TaxID=371196 RepID=A0A0V7ZLM6_9CYAN|nr:hypothetical protein [Mastigocoleus testarum]KST65377.1 hypothetical protein BC008_21510 [Mastigocoleus testarum BC008]KST70441.1 hypothetical protein BC008_45465 [Mastigocoleus testarum BC008]
MDVDIKIIRMIWAFVETSNPGSLLKLSDSELIQKLIDEVEKVSSLSPEDSQTLSKYVGLRTPLIRDLVYAKFE